MLWCYRVVALVVLFAPDTGWVVEMALPYAGFGLFLDVANLIVRHAACVPRGSR